MIDHKKLNHAIEFYSKLGYKYIEVPWLVSDEAYNVTKPKGVRDFKTFAGNLVASGEQSFIEMMLNGVLPSGKLCCLTPCFRDDRLDELHKQYFIKAELIHFNPKKNLDVFKVFKMVTHAEKFFKSYTHSHTIKKTKEGYDIELNGIELGSYGFRKYKDFRWIYGTGCAEPRLSQALASQ